MKLSQALEISRGFLFQVGQQYPRGHGYVCLGIVGAWKAGKISEQEALNLKRKVYRAIAGSTTLAAYLDNTRQLPREVYEYGQSYGFPHAYNLFHPLYVEKREEFLNKLMETILGEEKLGIA